MRKAIKSFETNVVGRTSDWNGFVATIFIGYTALSGGFAWVAKKLTRFGDIGWPEAVFIGLAGAAVLVLLLCAFLVAWRVFRPLSPPPPAPRPPLEIPRLSPEAIEDRATLAKLVEDAKVREQMAGKTWQATVDLLKRETVNRDVAIGVLAKQVAGWIQEARREGLQTADVLKAYAERELIEHRGQELSPPKSPRDVPRLHGSRTGVGHEPAVTPRAKRARRGASCTERHGAEEATPG